MKKMVSFFGDKNELFAQMNKRAQAYAHSRGIAYEWAPQAPFCRDEVVERLQQADVGVIDIQPFGEDVFSRIAGHTSLLVRFGVGYDKVDLAAATRHGIAVARTTGANTMGVAEMALAMIFAVRRQLKQAQRQVDEGCWDKTVVNETVGGTIGILGFGAIGQAFAGLLSGFGARVIAYDPFPNRQAAAGLGVELVDLDELLGASDAISVHVPYSPETHNLIDDAALGKMKQTAVIVNTSRGSIVDEDALYRACKNGGIRGAALDVFAEEPLPISSPLIGLDNVLLSPHLSSQTEESLWRIYTMAIDIAVDFFQGIPCPHILNPDYAHVRG